MTEEAEWKVWLRETKPERTERGAVAKVLKKTLYEKARTGRLKEGKQLLTAREKLLRTQLKAEEREEKRKAKIKKFLREKMTYRRVTKATPRTTVVIRRLPNTQPRQLYFKGKVYGGGLS